MADFNEVRCVHMWGLPPDDSSVELSNKRTYEHHNLVPTSAPLYHRWGLALLGI